MPRYRFADFTLSPRRRILLRNGEELPLIPRYFDLLVLLVERRGEAVHRRDIFDRVWTDVIVSDSALSQAVRTIRRALGDDSREPRFVRTVSRHGYQFVFAEVIEEDEDTPPATVDTSSAAVGTAVADNPAIDALPPATTMPAAGAGDPFEPLLDRIVRPAATRQEEEEQREAAQQLHLLGTRTALERLDRAGLASAYARALLRDTRWESPGAGAVPILGAPAALPAAWHLARMRLRRASALAAARWAGAALGGGLAGIAGGVAGGLLLEVAPTSTAPLAVVPVLALIGAVSGTIGGAGVGAGLAVAETVMRSHRILALTAGGAAGGGVVGLLIEWLARWSLEVLVGITPPIGGGLEGFVIGGAAACGYAVATRRHSDGMAAPRGRARGRVVALAAAACALAALALSLAGLPLVGGTIHAIAQASSHGSAVLTPLGRLIGEPGFGPVTAALIAMAEGAAFGGGITWGLTRRPRG